jgi:hypothetical protein
MGSTLTEGDRSGPSPKSASDGNPTGLWEIIREATRLDIGAVSVPITKELVEFLTSGVSILVATRDAKQRPEAVRGFAPSIASDRRHLDIIVPRGLGDRTIANVKANGKIAVAFARAIDNVSVQVKGTCRDMRPTNEADVALVDRYHAGYIEGLYLVGMPRSLTSRFRSLPGEVLTIEVDAVFSQTPGPGAGRRLEG